MPHPVISPKKLIEVALPLDAINAAAAREKSIRHGHPSTLHLWWARRPLAAARAVIFSQLVHDPEDLWRHQNPGQEPSKQIKGHWTKARARLFAIIEDLVKWENTTNETVLEKARDEIRKAWRETCELNQNHPQAKELFDPENMPGLHDPFAGGGAIPLEAQRLGLKAYASDLNPVAVLINKAMIEIPPKFAGWPPVSRVGIAHQEPPPDAARQRELVTGEADASVGNAHPTDSSHHAPRDVSRRSAEHPSSYRGAQGLAEDVRHYGQWMRDEAFRRIGHLYPPVEITAEMTAERPDLKRYEGQKLTVIAWLWARTVKSPNPAFSHVAVPLASTFVLSSKPGKEAYVQPVIEKDGYRFTVKVGQPPPEAKGGTKAARGRFFCIMSKSPIDADYVREQAAAGRMAETLIGVVADAGRERVYVSPSTEHELTARSAVPDWKPDAAFYQQALGFRVGNYGMTKWSDLFSNRQLVALSTFSGLIAEASSLIRSDALAAGVGESDVPLRAGGHGADAYADAVSVYLAFALSRAADYWGRGAIWESSGQFIAHVFTRNALPMTWDYPEGNPYSSASGGWLTTCLEWICTYLSKSLPGSGGSAVQADAQSQTISRGRFVSTDPPYYDNIGYADLSDYFYVWLRRSLRPILPDLLGTISVPKDDELVATPARHGTRQSAEQFFLRGMGAAMHNINELAHPSAPITIFYAFKQADTESGRTSSTGWETFLDAINRAGLGVTGTWPMRTERPGRIRETQSNALASSIILVCRPRNPDAPTISRRQFIRELNATLPLALDAMTRESEGLHSPVAPVDLSQAIIGPGMAVFSKYGAVLEADGSPMSVKTALQLINRFLAEDDFDADTQFCLRWFEQHHWDVGPFGEADVLARAKGTSVEGVRASGVVSAAGGKVRLIRPADYPADWSVAADDRLPVWEALHQLIRALRGAGESGAGAILAAVSSRAEAVRQLAYRLYTLCERAGLADDARAYNELVTSWNALESAAAASGVVGQRTMFD